MAIAIAIKPVPEGSMPGPTSDMPPSEAAQGIVDDCKKLSEDDLATLMHGISPDAIEVMEKIPDLAPFANYIEHGDTSEEEPEAPPGNTGPTKGPTARDQVASAMKANGIRGRY